MRVADIFVSYTSEGSRMGQLDRAKELEALGHLPHVHEWEIKAATTFIVDGTAPRRRRPRPLRGVG